MRDLRSGKPTSQFSNALVRVHRGLQHLIWPATCMNCNEIVFQSDSLLCKACWDDLLDCTGGEYCPGCGHEVSSYAVIEGRCARCAHRSFHFDGIIRCGIYAKCLQEMVLAFKKDRTELGCVLGPLVKSAFEASSVYERVDLLVPVPLHWTRRLARGYNQAQVIAKRLCNPQTRVFRALKRVRRTPYQPTVPTFQARRRNVRGAFAVRRESTVRGRRICLIDDVKTSGATLNECAKVLKKAGANEVHALVLAVAGQTRS